MKKIIFLLIMTIFTLTGCKTIQISNSYGYKIANHKEIYSKIDISAPVMDNSKKE